MGKVKKSRVKRVKNKVEKEDDGEAVLDSKETAIQTVLDQLQAPNVEEKCCGLQTLALLVENSENVEQIISNGVVKTAAPLLLDPVGSVRNVAAGALRNLSALGYEICDALMEQDIMTPLTCYFHQYAETWTLDDKSKTKSEDADTFTQCINLLWNLCESSELAVKYLCQSRILDILPRYMEVSTFDHDIVASVLQCVFVVIEDNPVAIERIKANAEMQLQSLLNLEGCDTSTLLIKTLSAGIVINMTQGQIAKLPPEVISKIMMILSSALMIDHRQACHQLSSNVPLIDEHSKAEVPKGKEGQLLENDLKSVSYLLDSQQCAIEIIANLCSCQDGEESIDSEDSSDTEDMGEEEICSGNGNTESIVIADDKLPPEVTEAIISLNLFDKVWTKAQLPAENVMLILKEYDGSLSLYRKLHNLQTRALLCINNMLSTLPINNLGDVNGVYKIWVDAGKLVFKQNSDNTLLESATAVMRAALDKMKCRENKNSEGSLFSNLALTDIEMMVNGIRNCQVPEIRSNLIRMIGTLALLLVNVSNEAAVNVICAITEFILEQAHRENEVWVLAEAIDTLVDLYSEDETDILAARVKLVDKLSAVAPILKIKARQQRKLPNEYKVIVTTAVSNLPRFIRYKKDRLTKLKN